ncbi:hypothetical protein QOT17_019363 [Balamuthia mandrillaris]
MKVLSSSALMLLAFLALHSLAQAQNCQVKVIHLLQGGSPIDVRVGEELVASNLAFSRSQTSQATLPCGPQDVQLFAAGNQESSFRSENFALQQGENLINYIVFGGELRAPAASNIFLLSHEPVTMPQTPEGQINLAFWHYSPAIRLEQVQVDVLDEEEEVLLSTTANFQQRSAFQTVPSAEALTFRFSNLELEELFSATRSVTALRNSGAGTIFALGQNTTELLLEADPAIIIPAEEEEESSQGSVSSQSEGPVGDGEDVSESSSIGSGSLSESLEEESNLQSGASSLSSFLFF